MKWPWVSRKRLEKVQDIADAALRDMALALAKELEAKERLYAVQKFAAGVTNGYFERCPEAVGRGLGYPGFKVKWLAETDAVAPVDPSFIPITIRPQYCATSFPTIGLPAHLPGYIKAWAWKTAKEWAELMAPEIERAAIEAYREWMLPTDRKEKP